MIRFRIIVEKETTVEVSGAENAIIMNLKQYRAFVQEASKWYARALRMQQDLDKEKQPDDT